MAMDMGPSWIEDIPTDPAYNWQIAEPLMRSTMARTLARELNCGKRLERLYEKGLFDPQHEQIPLEQEKTLAQMVYINIEDHGSQFNDDDLLFGGTEELRSEMMSSAGEDWNFDGIRALA
jgi:hypothetical protein